MNPCDQELIDDLQTQVERRDEQIRQLKGTIEEQAAEIKALRHRLHEIAEGLGDAKAMLEKLRRIE